MDVGQRTGAIVAAGLCVAHVTFPAWGHVYECPHCGGLRMIDSHTMQAYCPQCDGAKYCGYCGDKLTPYYGNSACVFCLRCGRMWQWETRNLWAEYNLFISDEDYRRAHYGQHG